MFWGCAGIAEPFGLQQSRQRLLVAPGRMLTRTTHPFFRRYTLSLFFYLSCPHVKHAGSLLPAGHARSSTYVNLCPAQLCSHLCMAGLWTRGGGAVVAPAADQLFFLPQKPFMPLGTLRQQLLFPMGAALRSLAIKSHTM